MSNNVISLAIIRDAVFLRQNGWKQRDIAAELKVSVGGISQALRRFDEGTAARHYPEETKPREKQGRPEASRYSFELLMKHFPLSGKNCSLQ